MMRPGYFFPLVLFCGMAYADPAAPEKEEVNDDLFSDSSSPMDETRAIIKKHQAIMDQVLSTLETLNKQLAQAKDNDSATKIAPEIEKTAKKLTESKTQAKDLLKQAKDPFLAGTTSKEWETKMQTATSELFGHLLRTTKDQIDSPEFEQAMAALEPALVTEEDASTSPDAAKAPVKADEKPAEESAKALDTEKPTDGKSKEKEAEEKKAVDPAKQPSGEVPSEK